MKTFLYFLAIASPLVPLPAVQAASSGPSVAIRVSVSPASSVRDGTTVTITASTTRPVSDIWIFDGSINDINNVVYVASCDAPPQGGYTRCSGHARHVRGVIQLPDPPYRQSKRSGRTHTFFACWNSVLAENCAKPVTVRWKKESAMMRHFQSIREEHGDEGR